MRLRRGLTADASILIIYALPPLVTVILARLLASVCPPRVITLGYGTIAERSTLFRYATHCLWPPPSRPTLLETGTFSLSIGVLDDVFPGDLCSLAGLS